MVKGEQEYLVLWYELPWTDFGRYARSEARVLSYGFYSGGGPIKAPEYVLEKEVERNLASEDTKCCTIVHAKQLDFALSEWLKERSIKYWQTKRGRSAGCPLMCATLTGDQMFELKMRADLESVLYKEEDASTRFVKYETLSELKAAKQRGERKAA